MIRNLPVDGIRLNLVAATAAAVPAPEWVELTDGSRRPSGNQARDKLADGSMGAPLWILDALAPGDERAELITVQIASYEVPLVKQFAPLNLEGLVARVAVHKKTGQLAMYWSATGVAPAAAVAKPFSSDKAA